MNLEFRRRSLLLPVTALLGSINNLSRVRFTPEDRKNLVLAAIYEYLGYAHGTVPLDRIIDTPYHEGRFGQAVMAVLNRQHVKTAGLEVELNSLHTKVFQQLHELLFNYGMLTNDVVDKRDNGVPGCFDHGYTLKLVSPKGKTGRSNGAWVLVEWVRPTLDMEEMSVNTFFLRIAKHLATRKQPLDYWLVVFRTTRLEAFLQIANFDILLTVLRAAGRK
ncbi:hypothetical protein G173_gp011 [Erwinia phage phiEaH2]|uniref:Uncharacterized protein n=1 Tax=Erwinia phage phiEaH2 TaxID=1029988 RepID=J7KC52_9CAUD|nr:hypothetical protein G173_gp011 [Erwinia phage phiEaH2]AFQ96556.1 hypothetical protein [Erwinia phage phiEaH2]